MTPNLFQCQLVGKRKLSSDVFELTFDPGRTFEFRAGQFISIEIPTPAGQSPLRRAYSIASAPGVHPIELCIQRLENGPGSSYLCGLEPGSVFSGHSPFGFFTYHPKPGRDVLFISTGTGVAPFRSMIQSQEFQASPPRRTGCLLGVRSESDILYDADFSALRGVEWVPCLSRETSPRAGRFSGRVTDYVKNLGPDFPWTETDFYLCGNGAMILELRAFLKEKGIARDSIHMEIYFRPDAVSPSLRV
jgi:ferredoxin-NADP reductase